MQPQKMNMDSKTANHLDKKSLYHYLFVWCEIGQQDIEQVCNSTRVRTINGYGFFGIDMHVYVTSAAVF